MVNGMLNLAGLIFGLLDLYGNVAMVDPRRVSVASAVLSNRMMSSFSAGRSSFVVTLLCIMAI